MNTPEATLKRIKKGSKGGAQPGAGRPKGSLELKARTLIEVKNRIAQKADDLLNAELIEALGAFVVMKADPEFPLDYTRVTDPDEIVKFIQEHKGASGKVGNSVYILAAKDGNYKSRQYLFDRAFGRPAQSVEVTTDPELAKLKSAIEARAQDKGIDYAAEVKYYLEHYAVDVKPEIKTQLASELEM